MVAITYFDKFLKNNYATGEIARLVNEEHSMLDYCPTEGGGGGLQLIDVLIDKTPAGRGGTLAYAQTGSQQANNSNVGGAQWIVPWGDYDQAVEIPDKIIDLSQNDTKAFFQNKKEEIDRLFGVFADSMEQYLFRNAGRSMCYGVFTSSTGVIQCNPKSDAVNIYVGDILQISANDGTSTGHTIVSASGLGYVIAVNHNAGTVTVSATSGGAAGAPANWVNSTAYYYFRNGDFGGDTTPLTIISGLQGFIPATDPTGTFLNVDRTVNVAARSGVRLTTAECAGLNTEQRIKKLAARMASMPWSGGANNSGDIKIWLHPVPWAQLAETLEARGQRSLSEKVGIFNFEQIKVRTANGEVSVMPNKYCPIDLGLWTNRKYMKLRHPSGFPKILNGDGLQMMRKSDSNNYEFRLVSYPAFLVKAPGFFGRFPVDATF